MAVQSRDANENGIAMWLAYYGNVHVNGQNFISGILLK